ncbi:MAG: hypothetical protein M1820_009415 [Bogoriella megaspora]|nr:MAG: hypothetical protein M1820_009415 [Bogoriella megaspora]
MTPSEVVEDYYGVLEVPNYAPVEIITLHYRELERALRANKNINMTIKTAFLIQRIDYQMQKAYDTLKDPIKRRDYDLKWPSIRKNRERSYETKKAESKAAEEQAGTSQSAPEDERITQLRQHWLKYTNDVSETEQEVLKLKLDLERLQIEEKEYEREEAMKNMPVWLWSFGSEDKITDEEKKRVELDHNQRLDSMKIKEGEISAKEVGLQSAKKQMDGTKAKINAEEEEVRKAQAEAQARGEQEKRIAEQLKKEQEASAKAEEERVREDGYARNTTGNRAKHKEIVAARHERNGSAKTTKKCCVSSEMKR